MQPQPRHDSLSSEPSLPLLKGLNEAQVQAVTTVDGPVLVVAGPGSGKTRVLTHRVAYLIEQRGVAPWHILAVTFTNKAAREMRTRLEALVGLERARQLNVGTFHATCSRILRREGHLIGIDPRFTIYDDGDQIDTVKQALKQLNLDPKQFAPRPILSRISAAKSQFIDPVLFTEQVESYWEEVVSRVYPIYQELLKRNRALDFDDLLGETLRLFDEQPDVLQRYQERFQYILVDEYQDTNRVQYLLVRALAERHRNLCVVGDPDQSIYGWRQADIRNILDFKRDYPDATEIHLELNYRSTGTIVDVADNIIRANTLRIDRRLRTENPAGEKVQLREAYDEEQEAYSVVGEIRRLVQQGLAGYKDIAVMYRTNAQSRAVEEAFVRSEIPYQIVGATRFYDRREIRDAMALLRVLNNPRDAVSLARLLNNTPLGKGIGSRTVQELERWSAESGLAIFDGLGLIARSQSGEDVPVSPPPVNSRAGKLLVAVYDQLEDLIQKSRSLALSELFDFAVDATGFAEQFQTGGDPDLLDRWENVLQLRGVLTGYDQLPEGEALSTFLEESALVADADTIAESGDQVTLITLHTAKGLEFAVVFLVGLEEGILPHARSMESETQLEEERRLFYVGVTRAKSRLYVSYAFRRTVWGRDDLSVRSRFVDSIPPDLLHQSAATRSAAAAGRLPGVTNGAETDRGAVSADTAVVMTPFAAGDRVFHDRFGDGKVLSVRQASGDQEVTVLFKRYGEKRLLASLANLRHG